MCFKWKTSRPGLAISRSLGLFHHRPHLLWPCSCWCGGTGHWLTLRGELCCWMPLLNWNWCWAPLRSPLHPGTWSLPFLDCCCMLRAYASPHSLWHLGEHSSMHGHRHTHTQKYQMWMLKKLPDLNLKYILMHWIIYWLVDLILIMKYFPSSEPQGSLTKKSDGCAHVLFLFEKRTGRTE